MSMNATKQLKAKGRDFPSLQNAVVDLHKLRFAGRRILHDILASHAGQKCVVLDPQLADPLNLITCGPAIFKAGGVRKLKLLAWERFDADNIAQNTIIYICRPQAELVKQIAHQIRSALGQGVQRGRTFAVYFVPCPTFICTQILREWQVFEDISLIGAMDIDLIPIDEDILSLELDSSFRECYLADNNSALVTVANSIMKMQSLFGCISVLHSKGKRANAVLDMLLHKKAQQDAEGQLLGGGRMPQIDTCLILDRDVDLITPLLSPLTYEALIDEFMGIKQGTLKVDPEVVEGYADDAARREPYLRLSSNDKLYNDIRNANIVSVGRILQQKSIRVGEMEAMKPDERTSSVQDIQDFLTKVPELHELKESLQYHIAITEKVRKITDSADFRARWQLERQMLEGNDDGVNIIFQKIVERENLEEVLRLVCLRSAVNNGFREKDFNKIRTEITRTYGWDTLLTLHNLERLQLFRKKENDFGAMMGLGNLGGSSTPAAGEEVDFGNVQFTKLREKFNLLNADVSSDDPNDIAYVTSGFAPLLARLVERAMNGQWEDDPSFAFVPGPAARTERQALPENISQSQYDAGVDEHGIARRKTMLVYIIGGVTYMEIAALRFLSSQLDAEFDIIIASTKLINGKNFIKGIEGHAFPVPGPNELKPPGRGPRGSLDIDRHELPARDSPFSPVRRDGDHYRLEQQQADRRLQDISAQQERQRQMEFARESQEAAERVLQKQQEDAMDAGLASDDENDAKPATASEGGASSANPFGAASDSGPAANPFGERDSTGGDFGPEGPGANGADGGDNPFGDDTATEDGTEDGNGGAGENMDDGYSDEGSADEGGDGGEGGDNPFGESESESENVSAAASPPRGHASLSRSKPTSRASHSGSTGGASEDSDDRDQDEYDDEEYNSDDASSNPFGAEDDQDVGSDPDESMDVGAVEDGGANPFGESESESERGGGGAAGDIDEWH